ncbi:DUF2726 domain-containing protein [Piscinibacter sp.]|jgi:hypothetical protein|uniref:DUF2726 domain-containing protein n=1 Tax=Piscinibacter sp. TaxID=1903157 RepID=UPI002F42C614
MGPLLLAIAIVLALLAGAWALRWRANRQRGDSRPADNLDTVAAWPPQATRVLTTVEREAYDRLRAALPAHMILAQVPLARFIKVPTRNSYAEWLRRVGHLCADFVVCDRHSQVIAVVEIRSADDRLSDRARKRQQRLARVLKAAAVPVHVWSENALPAVDAVREAIVPSPPPAPATPATAAAASAASAMARSVPGRDVAPAYNPFSEEARDSSSDEVIEVREAPPSTWFDDFDTAPAPLEPGKPKRP